MQKQAKIKSRITSKAAGIFAVRFHKSSFIR